jgi:hypothetical protein
VIQMVFIVLPESGTSLRAVGDLPLLGETPAPTLTFNLKPVIANSTCDPVMASYPATELCIGAQQGTVACRHNIASLKVSRPSSSGAVYLAPRPTR